MATLIFPLWSKGMISCGFWPSKPIENLQSEQNLSETGVRRRYLDLTSRMDDGNLCLLPNQVKGFEKVKDVFNWNFRQSTFAFHPAMHVKVCETFTFRKFFVEVMFLLKSESFFVFKMKVWPIHLPPIKWCISDALFIWGGGAAEQADLQKGLVNCQNCKMHRLDWTPLVNIITVIVSCRSSLHQDFPKQVYSRKICFSFWVLNMFCNLNGDLI